MPQVHPRSTGLLALSLNPLLQELKDLLVNFGRGEDPLESNENRGQFISAFERNEDMLNWGLAELQLTLESLAHGLAAYPFPVPLASESSA